MGYYEDIYVKRINRFGRDFKSRIKGEREYAFENYLDSSIYRIDFKYNGVNYPGTLEPYKQNELQVLHYLLTQNKVELPSGTIIELFDKNCQLQHWMVFWEEENKSMGYRRYIMLLLNHFLTWENKDHNKYNSWVYLCGPHDNLISTLRSGKTDVVYKENEKVYSIIMPLNLKMERDSYFTITSEVNSESDTLGYKVTGFDRLSTEGVLYVSADQMYLKDESPKVEIPDTPSDEYFWLKMGE